MRDRMPRVNVPAAFRACDQEPPDTICPNRFVCSGLRGRIAVHGTSPKFDIDHLLKGPQIHIEININLNGDASGKVIRGAQAILLRLAVIYALIAPYGQLRWRAARHPITLAVMAVLRSSVRHSPSTN